jgi:hypothetical protein
VQAHTNVRIILTSVIPEYLEALPKVFLSAGVQLLVKVVLPHLFGSCNQRVSKNTKLPNTKRSLTHVHKSPTGLNTLAAQPISLNAKRLSGKRHRAVEYLDCRQDRPDIIFRIGNHQFITKLIPNS